MTTLAELVERTSAHFPTNEPVRLGDWAQALIRELETRNPMSDPLTNGEPEPAASTEDTPTLAELKTATIDALALLMARVCDRPVDPVLRNEATQLVDVAMDWGRTAFVLLRLGDANDAYLLARAVRGIDGDIEPTPGDCLEATRVVTRMIDGARANTAL